MTDYRLPRHAMFMQIAHVVAQRSDCKRLNVGAVLVKNNRIISIGYNGSPSGELHCWDRNCQGMPGQCGTIHAEHNAIQHCLIKTSGLTLYVTHSPCPECAELIIKSGIREVYYGVEYRETHPLGILWHSHINVAKVLPNGVVIEWAG